MHEHRTAARNADDGPRSHLLECFANVFAGALVGVGNPR
jgi:hypothetical protein